MEGLTSLFENEVEVPRIRVGLKKEIENSDKRRGSFVC